MKKHNNPMWLMSSAFPGRSLTEVIDRTKQVSAQGVEVCVFPQASTRNDHIATHLDYEGFTPQQAQETIDMFNDAGLRFSLGTYETLIGGTPEQRLANQNHLLKLVRIAHLLGGDANDVKVGTFVGYDAALGAEDGGFEKNLNRFRDTVGPIIRYAESLGVTLIYENCPMEGWMPKSSPHTYNNLPATLAARKLMYAIVDSSAHGETYDPSHDIWQHTDPVKVIEASDMARIHRVHVKGTRNLDTDAQTHWGGMFPMQYVDPSIAEKAGVPIPGHEWDRHHYAPKLPGFGGSDSTDWTAFVGVLNARGFAGPYCIENEAADSKQTGDIGAIMQGFQGSILCISPMLWNIKPGQGYSYDSSSASPLRDAVTKDVPVMTIDRLV